MKEATASACRVRPSISSGANHSSTGSDTQSARPTCTRSEVSSLWSSATAAVATTASIRRWGSRMCPRGYQTRADLIHNVGPMATAYAPVHADRRLAAADMRRRLKAIFIGSAGNLVEWYDFYAYAAFALYFAGSFFPGSDPVVQQLNAAILFAVGFIVRPLGGWLFGNLADHYGRRHALLLSVLLMCFASLLIS